MSICSFPAGYCHTPVLKIHTSYMLFRPMCHIWLILFMMCNYFDLDLWTKSHHVWCLYAFTGRETPCFECSEKS